MNKEVLQGFNNYKDKLTDNNTMSLPNYLAKIKSAGMYRFTFDKSQIPPQAAETMRLVIGYSDKGPFNNPVYIDNKQDFINLFGNISKRLERKGVFFHRMALQALSAGPILALNLKPFTNNNDPESTGTNEQIKFVSFNPCDVLESTAITTESMDVLSLYDRNRFWKIDPDQLADKINTTKNGSAEVPANKYINIAATESKESSCSFFIRPCHVDDVKSYNVSVRDWYMNSGEEIPTYFDDIDIDTKKISDYFAEIYVFRGEFSEALCTGTGVLKPYFNDTVSLTNEYLNTFNEADDALAALAADPNSNFLGLYRGCLLPYFKDLNGNYVSLDVIFNADKDTHKMVMKLDDTMADTVISNNEAMHWEGAKWSQHVNAKLKPTYLAGYEYNTISKTSTAAQIHDAALGVLTEKGIFTALTNHVDSEYHYIVDTFATRIQPGLGKKVNIANVAKAKDNCLAIMNWPSVAEITKGIPGFAGIDKISDYNQISLPTEVNGASFMCVFSPLVFGDGTVKSTIPSAALVSNNFMEKWNSRQPYYIVAGPNYGRMEYEGLIGPDYNYGRADLDALEPYGVNAMVYVPRKGTYINSNQTAKQTPVSALSKIHVRELVIYLQNEIEAMLQNYQWELNTQTLRDAVKTKADALLEKIKANGGVYDYINTCDGSNNTAEVIDNEMLILDTAIEPARGAGKMVQRLTIHRTGGISSLTK